MMERAASSGCTFILLIQAASYLAAFIPGYHSIPAAGKTWTLGIAGFIFEIHRKTGTIFQKIRLIYEAIFAFNISLSP
jgi:hypothetical protein